MDAARPLRDVFADLTTSPPSDHAQAGPAPDVLLASGHPDLPDSLVAEAVGSYADTAPIEVAEHLSPYVMAHSPIPLADLPDLETSGWLTAMVGAPQVEVPADDADDLDDLDDFGAGAGTFEAGADLETDNGLDFGHGTPSDADDAGTNDVSTNDMSTMDEFDEFDRDDPGLEDQGNLGHYPAGPDGPDTLADLDHGRQGDVGDLDDPAPHDSPADDGYDGIDF